MSALIQSHQLERLQSLRRWLRAHGSGLHTLDIRLAAPTGSGGAAHKAVAAELGRVLAVACSANTVQVLRIAWLSRTQLHLGPELAVCGTCTSLRHLDINGGPGTVRLTCPLARLTAAQHMQLRGVSKWDRVACLPPRWVRLLPEENLRGGVGRCVHTDGLHFPPPPPPTPHTPHTRSLASLELHNVSDDTAVGTVLPAQVGPRMVERRDNLPLTC